MPPPAAQRVLEDRFCEEKFAFEDRQKHLPSKSSTPSLPNFAPNSAQHENENRPAATPSSASVLPRIETILSADTEDCDTQRINKLISDPVSMEDHQNQDAEAAQRKAMYMAATREIQAILVSCNRRKDNITSEDMEVVYSAFGNFMRCHPCLSEGYIGLFGGTVDPSLAILMPPLPPLEGNYNNIVAPPAKCEHVDHYNHAPESLVQDQFIETKNLSFKNVSDNNIANNAPPPHLLDSASINPAVLERLLQFSTHHSQQSPAVSDQIPNMQHDQFTGLAAAALLSLLNQHAEEPSPPIITTGPAAVAAVQRGPEPSSSPFVMPRTSNRNLRRMGLNPIAEGLLPGLPDRRPYTRPTAPYQGPPRGRPVGSGRRRRPK